jgi:DNA-binding response OmpR family regulator
LSGKTGNDKTIRILFIDDERDDAELVDLNLKKASLDVTTVSTPKEALTLLGRQSFDCVVSDYMMPDMNGIQLCAELRKKSSIPFIIYTAWDSEVVAKAALAAGVDYYIQKKENLAHFENLARSIEHAVENRREQQASS